VGDGVIGGDVGVGLVVGVGDGLPQGGIS
jgi:hypothetical protein